MKKVNLGVYDRITLVSLLGGLKCNLKVMRQGMKIAKLIELTKVQIKAIELKTTPAGLSWNDKKCKKIDKLEFELEDADFEFLEQQFKGKTDWQADQRLIDLEDKIDNAEDVEKGGKSKK